MAYISTDEEEQAKKNATPVISAESGVFEQSAPTTSPTSTEKQPVNTSPAPTSSTSPTSSGQWTNLSKYIGANIGEGERMGNQIKSNLENQINKFNTTANILNKNASTLTGMDKNLYGTNSGGVSVFGENGPTNASIYTNYTPEQYRNAMTAQPTLSSEDLQTRINSLNSATGRTNELNKISGRNITGGSSRLNQYLLQSASKGNYVGDTQGDLRAKLNAGKSAYDTAVTNYDTAKTNLTNTANAADVTLGAKGAYDTAVAAKNTAYDNLNKARKDYHDLAREWNFDGTYFHNDKGQTVRVPKAIEDMMKARINAFNSANDAYNNTEKTVNDLLTRSNAYRKLLGK